MSHANENTSLLGNNGHGSNNSGGHHHRSLLDGVAHEGESGRSGFDFKHFFYVTWLSSNLVAKYTNLLWPAVLVTFVLRAIPTFSSNHGLLIFGFAYVGMVPAANLIGFAGQELARKLPKVSGILIETALGGVVEILLFMILLAKHKVGEESAEEGNLVPVIQAAILGSILTNLLLCLGLCFVVGGIRHVEQRFHPSVSEVGTGLLLVAGFGLLIPSAFYSALKSEVVTEKVVGIVSKAHKYTQARLDHDIMRISQITSILLIIAFVMYVSFPSHDAIGMLTMNALDTSTTMLARTTPSSTPFSSTTRWAMPIGSRICRSQS
jgi:Ca2+:H+ antiporter